MKWKIMDAYLLQLNLAVFKTTSQLLVIVISGSLFLGCTSRYLFPDSYFQATWFYSSSKESTITLSKSTYLTHPKLLPICFHIQPACQKHSAKDQGSLGSLKENRDLCGAALQQNAL